MIIIFMLTVSRNELRFSFGDLLSSNVGGCLEPIPARRETTVAEFPGRSRHQGRDATANAELRIIKSTVHARAT